VSHTSVAVVVADSAGTEHVDKRLVVAAAVAEDPADSNSLVGLDLEHRVVVAEESMDHDLDHAASSVNQQVCSWMEELVQWLLKHILSVSDQVTLWNQAKHHVSLILDG
jgi:hypothetical protein